ncbi:FadR/GntR family transcriptional regulator [Kribbella hippodromi]|uniref:FadR/GntR family transcriptional regulator n=1 Tax=Kribbella hippodromi TaxID=434347 RepID=UPI0031E2D662
MSARGARTRGADKVPLGAQLADELRAMIKSQKLADGDVLPSEASMADQFGVSQRVVRDALRVLSQQGVIRTQQGKPAMVAERRPVAIQSYFRLAVEDGFGSVNELLELRQALEVRAAGVAATTVTAKELDELRTMLDEAESAPDLEHRVESDLAFHFALVRASRNHFFVAILESLSDVLAQERRQGQEITESRGGTHQDSDREHRQLLAALEAHDPVSAELLMRSHLDRVQQQFSRAGKSSRRKR